MFESVAGFRRVLGLRHRCVTGLSGRASVLPPGLFSFVATADSHLSPRGTGAFVQAAVAAAGRNRASKPCEPLLQPCGRTSASCRPRRPSEANRGARGRCWQSPSRTIYLTSRTRPLRAAALTSLIAPTAIARRNVGNGGGQRLARSCQRQLKRKPISSVQKGTTLGSLIGGGAVRTPY